MKLFPLRESSVSLSRLAKTGETEPCRLIFDNSREITLPLRHLIPTHEQTELGLEESQEFKAGKLNPNPCLRVVKAWKSVIREEETEEPTREKSVVSRKKGSILFSWKIFMGNEFGRTWRRNKDL